MRLVAGLHVQQTGFRIDNCEGRVRDGIAKGAHADRPGLAVALLPRFVANGVLFTDFQEITANLERWDDWCDAWSAYAAVHERLGKHALEEGYSLTAADHLKRCKSGLRHPAPAGFTMDTSHLHFVVCQREFASRRRYGAWLQRRAR